MGETDIYLSFAEEAVSIYRELGDPLGIPDALEELGAAQMFTGQPEAARRSLEEGRKLNLAIGNRQKAAECTFALGVLALVERHPDRAREPLEDAFATFKDLRDPWWTAFAAQQVGYVDRLDGKHDMAENRYRESIATFRQLDSRLGVGWVLYGFADLAAALGQNERAIRLIGASDAVREREGEQESFGLIIMGDVRQAARAHLDDDRAETLYQEGRAMTLEEAVAYALEKPGV